MVLWAEETFISSPDLIREMFSLLHRQYNGIGEVSQGPKVLKHFSGSTHLSTRYIHVLLINIEISKTQNCSASILDFVYDAENESVLCKVSRILEWFFTEFIYI